MSLTALRSFGQEVFAQPRPFEIMILEILIGSGIAYIIRQIKNDGTRAKAKTAVAVSKEVKNTLSGNWMDPSSVGSVLAVKLIEENVINKMSDEQCEKINTVALNVLQQVGIVGAKKTD